MSEIVFERNIIYRNLLMKDQLFALLQYPHVTQEGKKYVVLKEPFLLFLCCMYTLLSL